jgi:osmoprotectant transport system substrate-binding protein
VPVRRELDLGSRELVEPALRQGLVDVVPEYLGSALAGLVAGRTAGTVDTSNIAQVRAALSRELAARHLRLLPSAPAQDQNGVVVTAAVAQARQLRTLSDLARGAPITLAAPPECPTRPYCLRGLQQRYGLRVKQLLSYDTESQRAAAVEQGVADAAVMFTSDGRLATGSLVLLPDDRRLQPAENVTPEVSERALHRFGGRISRTLDRVSAALTQANLIFLNWRIDVAGKPIADEARGWLLRHQLLSG